MCVIVIRRCYHVPWKLGWFLKYASSCFTIALYHHHPYVPAYATHNCSTPVQTFKPVAYFQYHGLNPGPRYWTESSPAPFTPSSVFLLGFLFGLISSIHFIPILVPIWSFPAQEVPNITRFSLSYNCWYQRWSRYFWNPLPIMFITFFEHLFLSAFILLHFLSSPTFSGTC